MKKPIRILQIVDSLNRGSGVINVILNWHRNIDVNEVQFDYLYFIKCASNTFEEEIKNLGGRTYFLNYKGVLHPLSFIRDTYNFFKNHRYRTLHSHITHLNLFFYPFAKIFGTKNIIQHSHATVWSDTKLKGLRNYLMLHCVWPLITYKMGCGEAAGEKYFKKNFTIINNGIDLGKFAYNSAVRLAKRRELGLENNFVIGHIGRLSSQKNHKFLIDIFEQILKMEKTARLVLVGAGPLEEEIKNIVLSKNLQNEVIFLGLRKDTPELYQAFDCFVLPSLHEGMPVVGVEAQAAGLPCIFSDTITKDILISPSSIMISIKKGAKYWAEQILQFKNQTRKPGCEYLKAKGFDIKDIALKIQDIYKSIDK